MVLLVLAALGLLAALALADAMQAMRVARYTEGQVQARAAAVSGLAAFLSPSDLPWLCLQPPALERVEGRSLGAGGRVEIRWWSLGGGRIRGELTGLGTGGSRSRLLGRVRVDSLPADDLALGCPDATRLLPDGADWLLPHPAG